MILIEVYSKIKLLLVISKLLKHGKRYRRHLNYRANQNVINVIKQARQK